MTESFIKFIVILTSILQCSGSGLIIHVDQDGVDDKECIQGQKSCLTVVYALTYLQDMKSDQPPVEIIVSSSTQKFPCQGICDFNFTSLSITGVGDVIFRGIFGLTFEPDLKNVFVRVKGIHFENCLPKDRLDSDPFNPGVVFAFIDTLIFEQCTVKYGSSLFVRVQNLTVDSCIFSDFHSTALPVLTSWVSFPGSRFKLNQLKKSKSIVAIEKSKIGTIVIKDSLVTNNTGTYTGPSDDYPGPGYLLVDVSGLPLEDYFDIVHYNVLVVNTSFSNNNFVGKTTPFLSSLYSQNFSTSFTITNTSFSNNSIIPNAHDYNFDLFPLLALSMNSNTSTMFTIMRCTFEGYTFPPSVVLGSQDSVNIEINVLDSVFQSTSHVPQGLQIIHNLVETSANITTNFRGNKHIDG